MWGREMHLLNLKILMKLNLGWNCKFAPLNMNALNFNSSKHIIFY
jgi:hypothetical protein